MEVGQEDDPLLVHVLGGSDHHVRSGLDQTVGALVGVVLAQVNPHRGVIASTWGGEGGEVEGEWRGRKRQLVINMCVVILSLCN